MHPINPNALDIDSFVGRYDVERPELTRIHSTIYHEIGSHNTKPLHHDAESPWVIV